MKINSIHFLPIAIMLSFTILLSNNIFSLSSYGQSIQIQIQQQQQQQTILIFLVFLLAK